MSRQLLNRTCLLLLGASLAFPSAFAAKRVASVASFKGAVTVKRAESGKVEKVRRRRTPLFQGDLVDTAKGAKATLLFSDGSRIDLVEDSSVSVSTKGRLREISVTKGSLKSDIKKLPGMKTNFRTPAGVAAVKGTLVECVVKSEDKIEIAADLGLLTHSVQQTETSADLSGGKRLEIGFKKKDGTVSAKSLSGDVNVKTRNLATTLKKNVEIASQLDRVSDKISLAVTAGQARTMTDRGSSVVMDRGDAVDFVQTGTGTSLTVVSGKITMVDQSGVQTTINAGETAVEMIGTWLEPETPEGAEVMIPPGF